MSNMSSANVTMPKWPAWVLFGTMALCAYPAVTASAPRGEPAVTVESPIERPVKPVPAPVESRKQNAAL